MIRLQITKLRTHDRGPYSLHIAPGECISLRGDSGSGKSLLLRAIADLDPHEGQVMLDDHTSRQTSAPHWRQQVALLPAESQWWQDEVGAHFSEDDCPWFEPLGFTAEVLRWQISRLSSGEKQRLALARALMNRPRVLLLDEATASLDEDNVQRVEKLVTDFRHDTGAAVLWVSHDAQQAARVGDRHFRLSAEGMKEITP